jgi:hypothetical protein
MTEKRHIQYLQKQNHKENNPVNSIIYNAEEVDKYFNYMMYE